MDHSIELLGTACFALAVLHTFCVKRFTHLAHKFPEGSMGENFFHLLGEVEAVFLLWTGILISGIAIVKGWHHGAVEYIEHRDYTEPCFVFVIMCLAATRPCIDCADLIVRSIGRLLPLPGSMGFACSALVIGPLLGSFITEPAAMTLTAMLLLRQFFDRSTTRLLKYALIGTLFVNVSIGGTLTPFAAPPVLMVAHKYEWDFHHMIGNFGWKAALACVINASVLLLLFRKELARLPLLTDSDLHNSESARMAAPFWVAACHLGFLGFTVVNSHHIAVFMGGFIFFLGFATVTREFQEPLKLKESLLVGGFLAGLVSLGGLQSWWLQPLLNSLGEFSLYMGATGLTAITDNAALTYLGSQVPLSDGMKYALVAGSVTGGGLTVIANAPNPAGYGILNKSFGEEGISPLGLFLAAAPPTLVAILCFWGLRGINF